MTTRSVLSDADIEAWLAQAVELGYERPERLARELLQARAALTSAYQVLSFSARYMPKEEWTGVGVPVLRMVRACLPVEEP